MCNFCARNLGPVVIQPWRLERGQSVISPIRKLWTFPLYSLYCVTVSLTECLWSLNRNCWWLSKKETPFAGLIVCGYRRLVWQYYNLLKWGSNNECHIYRTGKKNLFTVAWFYIITDFTLWFFMCFGHFQRSLKRLNNFKTFWNFPPRFHAVSVYQYVSYQ